MAAGHIVILQSVFISSIFTYDQLVKIGTTEATSSTTLLAYSASLTVDGDFRQDISYCLHTDDYATITEAWLRVNLKGIYSLKSVKFWYREGGTNTRRLPGYSIRVSNNTSPSPPNSICYQDPKNTTLPFIIEKDCERTAQYVWIYQNNTLLGLCPMLEICEVQIFGCTTGRFGDNCNKTCGHCQNSDHCGIVSGKCDELGCANRNFNPPLCKICIPGMYGQDCTEHCSAFCRNKLCDINTGICIHGCERGYNGSYCNQTCPPGNYGYGCREQCGHCVQMQACNHINGYCAEGCIKGFQGELCNIYCRDGEYGNNCAFKCSGNCFNNAICNRFNGTCHNCSSGYVGPKCDTKCIQRMYGMRCSLVCGSCVNSTNCNHVDGKCALGCAPGWQISDKCDIPCNNGTYGMHCMYNCKGVCPNNETCNKIDGTCTAFITSNGNNEFKVEIIIIVVVLILILMIIGGTVLLRYRRKATDHLSRKKEDENVYHLPDMIKDENEYDELNTCQETASFPNQRQISPINLCEMSESVDKQPKATQGQPKVVMIPDLLSRIRALERHSNKGFLREYQAISTEVSSRSCKVARLRENLAKNTHAATLPYDHSRVMLESTPGNYFNASFIRNVNGEKTYIASQGTKENTVSDFWQLVWQENVNVIAMTVTMSDWLQRKCQKYWPDSTASEMNQRGFVIHLQSDKTYSSFTIRDFQLLKKETRESRQIRHLQFTAWPEHEMPRPLELLDYYHYVSRAMKKHSKSTLLVQCSSGSGPTAVIIALDALFKHGQKTGMVNIADFVNKMRTDRMNMIENPEQYICLYRVLYECFRANVGVLDKDRFLTESTHEHIVNEFHILSSIKPSFVDVGDSQTRDGSTEYQNIMKHGKANALQSSAGSEQVLQCSAIILPSFTTKDCIITGRYPSHGEAVDLIHLLINQRCSTLVSVNPLSEVPYFKEWFFQPVEVQDYQVEVTPVAKMSTNVTLSTLRAKRSMDKNYHQLTVYELTSWKYSENIPRDIDAMLDVIKSVQLDKDVDVNKKLVILSKDGATGGGVFCAVYNAIQQLQQDEEVDMFTIVRQLQSRRPEMIFEMSEYQCCYIAVQRYLERK